MKRALVLWTVCLMSCGQGEPSMSKNRPVTMAPDSWIGADGNGKPILGMTESLATTFAHLASVPTIFNPDNQKQVVAMQAGDSGDARVVGVHAQLIPTVDNPVGQDVMLDITYGAGSGQQRAYVKIGSGVVFNLPCQMIKAVAKNLGGPVSVAVSAVPRALPHAGASTARWAFQIVQVAPFFTPFIIERLNDVYAPGHAAAIPAAMVNVTPAPQIIPPFANRVSVAVIGTPATVYFLTQLWNGTELRTDTVTLDANGFGLFDSVPLYGMTSFLRINEANPTGAIATAGSFAFDFELGL